MDYQEFYIDVINFLSKEIDGIECLVKIENEKYDDKNADKIDFNRLVFRYLKKFYAVHMDIIFSKFLNVHMFENELFRFISSNDRTFLSQCQSYVISLYELKNKLLLNNKYYNFLPENEDTKESKKFIEEALNNIENIINILKEEYSYAFYHINMLVYVSTVNKVLDKIKNPIFDEYQKEKVCHFKFLDFKTNIIGKYHNNHK